MAALLCRKPVLINDLSLLFRTVLYLRLYVTQFFSFLFLFSTTWSWSSNGISVCTSFSIPDIVADERTSSIKTDPRKFSFADDYTAMELAHPDSAPWFVSLFHQYSLTIEHWRRLYDSKSSHFLQLQEHLGTLETELRELRSSHAKQSEAIAGYRAAVSSLEYDLECQRQSASAFCNAPLPSEPCLHQQTHHLGDCYLCCSPTCLMPSEVSSPNEITPSGDDGVCELGMEDRARKRRRSDDGE